MMMIFAVLITAKGNVQGPMSEEQEDRPLSPGRSAAEANREIWATDIYGFL